MNVSSTEFRISTLSRPQFLDNENVLLAPIIKKKYRLIVYNIKTDEFRFIKPPLPPGNDFKNPILSNDLKWIAFTRADNTRKTSEICIIDINGKNFKQLTYANHYSYKALFSPNGKKIYFLRSLKQKKRTGTWLYSTDLSGRNEDKISKGYYVVLNPTITSDGKYILFTDYYKKTEDSGLDQKINQLEIDTGKLSILLDNKRGLVPASTKKNYKIIYLGTNCNSNEADEYSNKGEYDKIFSGIYERNLDTKKSKLLLKLKFDTYYLSLSPDNKKALYFWITHLMQYDFKTNSVSEIFINKEKILERYKDY